IGLANMTFPLYCLLLFSFNIYTFWKPVRMAVSIIQILANLILIPAFQIIFALAISFAIGLAIQMGIEDPEKILNVFIIVRGIIGFLLLNCAYIVFRIVLSRKSQQTIKRAEA